MSDGDELTARVGRLRREVNVYRERYGEIDEFEPLRRLDHALAARRARLDALHRQERELLSEITAIEVEIAGIERGVEALLGEVLPRVARRFAETWSPTPVLGYRLWAVTGNEFHGVRTRWENPALHASCTASPSDDEVPHTDGRCGRLGCGIYAAKSAHRLLDEFSPALGSSFAAGLVALSGKVVEHEHGYRGAHGSVLAVAVVVDLRAELTADPERLTALFAGAAPAPGRGFEGGAEGLIGGVTDYLISQQRRHDPWTSESRNA